MWRVKRRARTTNFAAPARPVVTLCVLLYLLPATAGQEEAGECVCVSEGLLGNCLSSAALRGQTASAGTGCGLGVSNNASPYCTPGELGALSSPEGAAPGRAVLPMHLPAALLHRAPRMRVYVVGLSDSSGLTQGLLDSHQLFLPHTSRWNGLSDRHWTDLQGSLASPHAVQFPLALPASPTAQAA